MTVTKWSDVPPASPARRRELALALAFAAVGLLVAFGMAAWTKDTPVFSLAPPGGGPNDFSLAQRRDLHVTFFTIWASLILATPALSLFPSIRRSERAFRWWRIAWTASLLVFSVHFFWATIIMFGNDWQRILHTPRVSAPRLDSAFAVWWTLDVVLAWTVRSRALWLRVERVGVHLLAFTLFVMGAAREGELAASRALGWMMIVVTLAGVLAALRGRRGGAAAPTTPT